MYIKDINTSVTDYDYIWTEYQKQINSFIKKVKKEISIDSVE